MPHDGYVAGAKKEVRPAARWEAIQAATSAGSKPPVMDPLNFSHVGVGSAACALA